MKNGQVGVRVALELGPNDEYPALLTDPAWTNLTDRVKGYRDRRGRSDVLQLFQPGTAEVTLDNSDRMLDPSNPDGLLFSGVDPIGLPLCLVKITQYWNGTEYDKFTGYLGPEGWPGDVASYGESGEVTLNVMDQLGHSPALPPDAWGVVMASLHPEWWSRMDDFEFPVLDDGSPVPNSIGTDHAEVEGTTGISRAWNGGAYDAIGVMTPGLLLAGDHIVRIPNASIMPDGDQDKFTVMLWWSSRTELEAGEAYVMQMVHPFTSVPRFDIYVDSVDGDAYVTTYDSGGSVVDTATIHDSLLWGRWDHPNSKHLVIAQWDAGSPSNLTVWFGGISATLNIPGDLYVSDLILGAGNGVVDSIFDEVATWRQVFNDTAVIAPILLAASGLSWWAGQTFSDRLGGWIEATGRDVTVDDTNEWHMPAPMTQSLWGLIRNKVEIDYGGNYSVGRATLPDNLADAFQITVESGGGARWATKGGRLRARVLESLTDPTWAEHYATPVLFTDADATLDAGEYRHASVEVTGLRLDRVVNDASVKFLYSDQEPPDIDTAVELVCRKRDIESIARYQRRAWEVDTEWAQWPLNQTMAELVVERYAQPRQEFQNVRLDPRGTGADSVALAEWLIVDCELEKACTVTYTPFGADPVTVEGLNIQQIQTDYRDPDDWTVDLVVAQS